MIRKLASVRVVDEIRPIDGADFVELAIIGGWQVVVKKDDNFRPGDVGVYFEIDSVLPDKPEYEFMRETKFRVKTRRFRKQLSQGLLMPLHILQGKVHGVQIDQDVTEILGVKKYEPGGESRAECRKGLAAFSPFRKRAGKPFPTDILQRTDEERVQNLKGDLKRLNGQSFYVSEKLHGKSWSAYLHNDKFGVCSRNFDLQRPGTGMWEKVCEKLELRKKVKTLEFWWTKFTQERNLKLCNWVRKNVFRHLAELVIIDIGVDPDYWNIALELNIEDKLRTFCRVNGFKNLAIQGELCGPGILGNQLNLDKQDLFVFQFVNPETREKYSFSNLLDFSQKMGLKTVPILDSNFVLNHTCDELLKMAEGKSVINPKQEREGVVLRTHDMKESFKVVSNKWLLKHED